MGLTIDEPAWLEGTDVRGADGTKLGNVEAVYYDNETDLAEWVSVRSGIFGSRTSIVPLRTAEYDGRELRIPYDRAKLRAAPGHDLTGELSPGDEEALIRHYGIADGDTVVERPR